MDFQLPELGEGIYEAELVEWRVKPGDDVKPGQSLAEVLTDKATIDLPSPFTGRISELHFETGSEMKVGQVILTYTTVTEEEPAKTTEGQPRSSRKQTVAQSPVRRPADGVKENGKSHSQGSEVRAQAAPAVRRLARGLGIDLATIAGSGPSGRILIDDLTERIQSTDTPAPTRETQFNAGQESTPARGDHFKPGARVKLRGVRRKIAQRMVQAKQKIPHFSYVDQCDVTNLVRLRASLKESFAQSGVKLTFLPFVVKAVVAALAEVPLVNSRLDEATEEILLHDHYHIGIATDTPDGLVVPVVRNANRKDLMQLAGDIQRLTSAARSGKLAAGDLRGSTFTITSIGSIGGLITTPIINYPEVGIAGIGKIVRQPMFDDAGNVRAADMIYLSYSFDHRVLDGATAAVFSNAVIRQLENPATT
jgi:pyruvate/2-oxoglutarate dehydrogenase complex dihydrolipoamide acyltransferase (E2) component